ncbi:MAG TPA: FAD-dependent oxidoreductase [Acidimicrobiia bacterium]|nr:FAD-dependent oxidoreductase [Acidimicrobiia bacterium]
MSVPKRVVVVGGGVAGMSAAHELAERGYIVEVFERNPTYVGGKARSVDVPDTNTPNPERFLPGEHGFRFFPGFYRHVTDTMKRIPFQGPDGSANRHGCFDNLVSTERVMIARYGKPSIITDASFPRSLSDLKVIVRDLHGGVDVGLTTEEEEFFAERIWQLMTSCRARRDADYERLSWWDYLDADRFSKTYQSLLVAGLTRTLVAAQARSASTKTGGDILLQLLFTMMTPGGQTDRVLDGPTNEVWLTPWLEHLRSMGVEYHKGSVVTRLHFADGSITGVEVRGPKGRLETVTADHYILATPIERAAPLLDDAMVDADPTLGALKELAKSVSWMNGIQFYLSENVEITRGHIIFSDSEWALTGISQPQFWDDYDLSDRFDGRVKGILSVDVSDWLHTAYDGVIADDADAERVKDLVWDQIEKSLNVEGRITVSKDMIVHWYLDRDIRWNPIVNRDDDIEPLLVNTVNSWALRPEAVTRIPNLFLASDYVRTNTDLATMEGANEAARRAVNGILAADGSRERPCSIWPLSEPLFFAPFKWLDKRRFGRGQPWSARLPWSIRLALIPWGLVFAAVFFVRAGLNLLRPAAGWRR